MIAFALAVFLLLITPGPGVLSLAGVGAAFGWRQGISYLSGLFVGNNLVCIAVISGLATVLLANPSIRMTLLIISAAYLGYLAFRIAFSGAKIAFIQMPKPGLVTGTTIQLINPKAYAVNTALFTSFLFAPDNFLFETGAKLIIMNIIWIPLHLIWLAAGVRLHRLNLNATSQRRISIAMALSLVIVVILAVGSVFTEFKGMA